MQMNSRIENPTRIAYARTILLDLALPSCPSFIMKKSAEPRLTMMETKAKATR